MHQVDRPEFMATMLTSVEACVPHEREHHFSVRQRKLLIEKLKSAGSLSALTEQLGYASDEETIQKLMDFNHINHLTVTDHDIITFTDFAAKVRPS